MTKVAASKQRVKYIINGDLSFKGIGLFTVAGGGGGNIVVLF